MKILVCISKAPDTTTKITFKDNDSVFNEDGVTFIINPYDEWYALVRALELKETLGGNVTVLHVGLASSDTEIRKALAIGADDAVRIDADPNDASFVAKEIAEFAKDKSFDLILVGKETISFNGATVGGQIAGYLDLPFISLATKLDIETKNAVVEHDIDGGIEVLECEMPLVISCSKGMAEARIPNMRGIMAARTKPLQVVPSFGSQHLTKTTKYSLNPGRTTCKFIDAENAQQLIELLHNEAKVI
jgi:electron transfer flavoprotein beta subunit